MLESRPEGPLLNSSQGISTCDCLENRDIPVNSAVNHYCYPLDNQSQIHLGYGFIHINPKQGWVNSSTTMVSSWVLSTRLDAGRSGRGVSKMTDWWQMPYKYQTWHDWHDDHNGKFPELNMMIIFFWALLIIYIMFISFPFWWIQSPWCPPSFGVTRSQVTLVRPTRIKTGKCFHRCSGLRRSQIPWDVPFAPQRVAQTGRVCNSPRIRLATW